MLTACAGEKAFFGPRIATPNMQQKRKVGHEEAEGEWGAMFYDSRIARNASSGAIFFGSVAGGTSLRRISASLGGLC